MSHEKSVTFQRPDGRWVNVSSVVGGKALGEREVQRRFSTGTLKPLGGKSFGTLKQAVDAAKRRSAGQSRPPARRRRTP